ncbi:SPOSA6832_03185 [Sporobolomyces salmonicolor]|uniref:cystathionine beta-synthase n=1 Tax=Sporidiobolus salmonicolor TaxID=5005 RepID=A0A0D6ENB0_SPOSA|nr:SPOSA6832_03185 [Sporobolomyces salmonicolor]
MTTAIHANVLSLVGHTPLVRMDKIAKEEGLNCNLLAKVEGFSAGGSVKDRIALRMVEEAERQGKISPGKTVLVEPTSGNTGIGLALVAAVKGYRCIIVMPEKMSREKQNTLKAVGAEIIRTPTEAAYDSPESHIGVANRLVREIPHAVMLDQYNNPANPDAHYHTTALEILAALASSPSTAAHPSSGTVDLIVAGAGTGGTITGLSKRLRESNPALISLGVDPVGSVLARPESLNVLKEGESAIYRQEGTGYDFVPHVLDHHYISEWVKSNDEVAFATTRRLIRTEGLLVGGSSGASVWAALQWLKSGEGYKKIGGVEGKNVVIILPDSIRNYITSTWLNDDVPAEKSANSGPAAIDAVIERELAKVSGLATPP